MRAFRIAYDGRPFHGFQRQPSVPTVEDAIFDALRALEIFEDDKPPGYSAAGRTDAGVSARAQTVAIRSPDWLSPRALNGELPDSVWAWASADAPDDFHATYDAQWREYRYFLYAPDIDDERARDALAALRGEHDFHNLTPDDENTVRRLRGEIVRDGSYLVVTLRSSGFARELVRRVVSLVRAVGSGAAPVSKVATVLGTEPIDGPEGVPPAPASPLVLRRVAYDVSFHVDEEAARAARSRFHGAAVESRTRSKVADAIAAGIDTATESPR
ncbi:Pseudouridylate synthase [Halanaeroarchaeum sp. HSR-CO]|uniref:tRNA pseudouridine(38-40) synthase TruA n=1 Tax=Halanaeroarchaeum sp. HSR-CO TaxID=2866382 RepID=UPI00217E80BE|nr:tRNA pseudouridine(38-40) synthase TruA [Halanaeroarchaeum sp. HSR-CO]UWG46536.1 Pseudouridylate synthase [Halanaeroarchaeum sp. HSR-CO]